MPEKNFFLNSTNLFSRSQSKSTGLDNKFKNCPNRRKKGRNDEFERNTGSPHRTPRKKHDDYRRSPRNDRPNFRHDHRDQRDRRPYHDMHLPQMGQVNQRMVYLQNSQHHMMGRIMNPNEMPRTPNGPMSSFNPG